jgi:predicted DCC family thiol-disulfide oxidoreductase YuxK
MITVFYDGKCSLCSKEINYYRKIAPNYVFEWKDITNSADDLKKHNISASEGLKLLHAIDESGCLHFNMEKITVLESSSLYDVFTSYPTNRKHHLSSIRRLAF